MSPALRIGATGFALIAVCYGFARFAFGLFLPQIDAELGLGASLSGMISDGSFADYCIAIIASAALTERIGARAVVVTAALVAAFGMAAIALAPSPLILAMAVVVAGSSTGLASPPMAATVSVAVQKNRQDLTNTVINAGTSAGVALSGPIALAIAGEWRLAFGAFAVVAVMLAIAAAIALPSASSAPKAGGVPRQTGAVKRLIASSFLMGAASTAMWSFGGQLVAEQMAWGPKGVGMLWTCIGVGGVAGAWAGTLVKRFGLESIHRTFLGLMSATILATGAGIGAIPALLGGVLFGAAYVMLTGVYLIWGTNALPDHPATGLMIGFLTIAIGQTAGAPLFGFLLEWNGPETAVICFALATALAGLFKARGAHVRVPA